MLLPKGKNMKIWGVSYGLVGDLIMGLPVLTYFEKKYPNSYIIWAIEKKVGFMAPFFLNHPLIDKIQITQNWNGIGERDKRIIEGCNFRCTYENWQHSRPDWYNYNACIEETAYIAGVKDIFSCLSYKELYPTLYKWFDVGRDHNLSTYSKENQKTRHNEYGIAIFPFATATGSIARSPSREWWDKVINTLTGEGYSVYQFGMPTDSGFKNAYPMQSLTFFDQVKMALSCKMSIGTDSGSMWVMGAYSHPAVHLMTNWLQKHTTNFDALLPANRNGRTVFAEGGVNNIKHDRVIEQVKEMM